MKMNYIRDIEKFRTKNEQEESDKKLILSFIEQHPDVLTRDNGIAHITSSGFIMNPELTKVLLIHHNIRGVWAWTGGHADGDDDLLAVALREAREETGIEHIRPLSSDIASLDILINYPHVRRGVFVSAHLHLSVSYILIAEESDKLTVKPDENSAIEWFPLDFFTEENFHPTDVYLYNKLIDKAKKMKREQGE